MSIGTMVIELREFNNEEKKYMYIYRTWTKCIATIIVADSVN